MVEWINHQFVVTGWQMFIGDVIVLVGYWAAGFIHRWARGALHTWKQPKH